MIELLLELLKITDSKDDDVLFLKGKYHLKTTIKEAWKQHKEFG